MAMTYQKTLQVINTLLQPLDDIERVPICLAFLLMRLDVILVRLKEVVVAREDVLRRVSAPPVSWAQRARHVGMRWYLDQLILHVIAEARVLVAVPEGLCIFGAECARRRLLNAVLGDAVRCERHGGGIWKVLSRRAQTLSNEKREGGLAIEIAQSGRECGRRA